MKKAILFWTAAAILAAVLFYPCHADAISAQSAILMDGQTGRVLFQHNAQEKSLIASTTKMMTALVICRQCHVLEPVRIPKEAVGVEGSSMYLREGEVLTVQELLYGLMLSSGNDAAVALAIHCSGTVAEFVSQMNETAHALGLQNTHFSNPHGLDAPEHYSTAADLAVLAARAMEDPIFAQTVSTRQVRVGERYLTNHNRLLWQVEGVDGIKTGYTRAAGRILVSSARRNGRRLICVTIHDPNDWTDHAALYADGFSQFVPRQVICKGQPVGILTVFGGETDGVRVLAGADFSCALAEGERVEIRLPAKEFVYAPVAANQHAGFAYICVDGKPVGRIPIYFESTVERRLPEEKSIWQRWFGG